MKNRIVSAAIQVLPLISENDPYDVVDKAIEEISNSGLKYRVTPFETVIEGKPEQILSLIETLQSVCFSNGARELITNIKLHQAKSRDVYINEKTYKYET